MIEQRKRTYRPLFVHMLSSFSLLCRFAFAKIWINAYNNKDEHVASLMLRKTDLRGKIHHRILECEIFDNDQLTNIGRIYPFSTDLERSEYRHAAAVKSKSLRIHL